MKKLLLLLIPILLVGCTKKDDGTTDKENFIESIRTFNVASFLTEDVPSFKELDNNTILRIAIEKVNKEKNSNKEFTKEEVETSIKELFGKIKIKHGDVTSKCLECDNVSTLYSYKDGLYTYNENNLDNPEIETIIYLKLVDFKFENNKYYLTLNNLYTNYKCLNAGLAELFCETDLEKAITKYETNYDEYKTKSVNYTYVYELDNKNYVLKEFYRK